ncbi:unnamed protein product, partial [Ectocarpus sp. 8 AP-2014]
MPPPRKSQSFEFPTPLSFRFPQRTYTHYPTTLFSDSHAPTSTEPLYLMGIRVPLPAQQSRCEPLPPGDRFAPAVATFHHPTTVTLNARYDSVLSTCLLLSETPATAAAPAAVGQLAFSLCPPGGPFAPAVATFHHPTVELLHARY